MFLKGYCFSCEASAYIDENCYSAEMIAKITSRGRVTLPAKIRKILKIEAGDRVDFETTDNGEIRGKLIMSNLENLANVLPPSSKRLSIEEIDNTLHQRGSD